MKPYDPGDYTPSDAEIEATDRKDLMAALTEHHDPKTAEEILDNFETIVRRERLIRGNYLILLEDLGDFTGVPERGGKELHESGAICGGARACALGSLSLAARIEWPGSEDFSALCRGAYAVDENCTPIQPNAELERAMTALDKAAIAYAQEHRLPGIDPSLTDLWSDQATHQIEQLFENLSLHDLSSLPEYTGPASWYVVNDEDGPERDPDVVNDEVSVGMTGVILEVSRRARELLAAEVTA